MTNANRRVLAEFEADFDLLRPAVRVLSYRRLPVCLLVKELEEFEADPVIVGRREMLGQGLECLVLLQRGPGKLLSEGSPNGRGRDAVDLCAWHKRKAGEGCPSPAMWIPVVYVTRTTVPSTPSLR